MSERSEADPQTAPPSAARYIALHPYSFRPGEAAAILGVVMAVISETSDAADR